MTDKTTPPGGTPATDGAFPEIALVEDEEVIVEWHPEDWIGMAIFWILGIVVFVQFFTRYVLNDSLSWTEEIARYLLMVLTFVGAITVTRRRTHIAVEVLEHYLPEMAVRVLRAFVETVTLGFMALLAWYGVTLTERMQIQRMTMIDASMAIVYGAIAAALVGMLVRAVMNYVRNARAGWRPSADADRVILD